MKKKVIFVLLTLIAGSSFGCSSPATDEQIDKMCKNLAEITGKMRGTSEEEEVAKAEEEHQFKEKQLKDELARDLGGWDDVYKQKFADFEKAKEQEKALAENAQEEKSEAEEAEEAEEEEKTPEEKEKERQEKKKKLAEEYEKKKQETQDQFEKYFQKLKPDKERAIRKAKEYVESRKKKADKAIKKCAAKAKEEGVTGEVADCRIKADSEDSYLNACR
ncbi:MAG: hypothetical protein GY847_21950 [Proteobacteria bacterium]|nr:hypothetical protein [Pseudomonadota bacterium]